ncbi:jg23991 [Pararge aegeria aegeria]|uniref:Jg23991 protein n=1 Tax=Pararge aegeria aegeria TaxID=348720 RepID=A0A8S4R423_9NEOP|nr:jg23991 [Pararge aegeria aegeria]
MWRPPATTLCGLVYIKCMKTTENAAGSSVLWLRPVYGDTCHLSLVALYSVRNVVIFCTGRVHRCSHKYQLRTSPSNGSASITSPFLHCTASLGQTQHLFVRRGERRMHFDGNSFIVRNGGHSAGFDDKNQLKVY